LTAEGRRVLPKKKGRLESDPRARLILPCEAKPVAQEEREASGASGRDVIQNSRVGIKTVAAEASTDDSTVEP